MISGGKEVNLFPIICSILGTKFRDNPLLKYFEYQNFLTILLRKLLLKLSK